MRYWMSGTDGKVYGPYDLAQLQEFVKSGRLFPATSICAEGGSSWVPAGTVPGILPAGASAQASDPSLAILIPVRVDPIALIAGYRGLSRPLLDLDGARAIRACARDRRSGPPEIAARVHGTCQSDPRHRARIARNDLGLRGTHRKPHELTSDSIAMGSTGEMTCATG